MVRTLSKTLCLLAAALLMVPSALAAPNSKKMVKAGTKAISAEMTVKKAPQKESVNLPRYKSAVTASSKQIKKARTGAFKAPKINLGKRYASSNLTEMYATVCYSDYDDLGIYSITSDGQFTFLSDACQAGAGAVIDDNYYRVCYLYTFWGFIFGMYLNSYDMENDWECTTLELDDISMIAVAMDKDPASGMIYGCFYNEDASGYNYATVDFDTMTKNVICDLSSKWDAFSFDANGQAYAIGTDGCLYKVDKATGATTLVGSTGYEPYYQDGGCIDKKNNKFYWSCSDANDNGYLFAVDLATAEAEMIYDGGDEIIGIVIPEVPEDGAPATPENLQLSFPNGALSGNVSFNIPTTTYDGSLATGNVKYEVKANGELLASGNAAYGASVSETVTVPASGNYKFTVVLSNEVGSSKAASASMFVGNDTPVTPVVAASYADGKFTISWDPVTLGVNAGFVDLANLTYQVVRYPDEVQIAEATTATTLVDAVAEPDNLTVYYYTVQAMYGDVNSELGQSNKIALGAVTPPYAQGFDSEDSLDAYTIVDANEDGSTWMYNEATQTIRARYSTTNDADDWIFTPAVKLEEGMVYNITVDMCAYSSYYAERGEVKIGLAPTPDAMVNTIVPVTDFSSEDLATYGDYFAPETTGKYYIGIHACSDADAYFLVADNVTVSAPNSMESPGAVTDAKVAPGLNGAKTATISFTTPNVNFVGEGLSELTKVDIYRGETLVKTFTNPGMKQALSFEDALDADGYYDYTIVPSNSYGEGKTVSLTTYVGINYAADVQNVKVVETATGEVSITWDAVTTDSEGYPLDASLITYQVRDLTSDTYAVLVSDLTGTDCSIEAVSEGQDFVQYGVSAVTARGEGSITPSDMIPVGEPYSMPYFESFTDGGISTILAQQSDSYSSIYLFTDDSGIESSDLDNGFLSFYAQYAGSQAAIFTGKISLEGATAPMLSFDTYCFAGSSLDENELLIQARTLDGEWKTIANKTIVELTGEENPESGWYTCRFGLDQFKGKVIQLRFVGTAMVYSYTMLDAIRVDEALDHDLMAKGITAPSKVEEGEEFNVTVKVENAGANAASGYNVVLLRNGKTVAVQDGEELASFAAMTYTFPQQLGITDDIDNVYYAVINYDKDLNKDNNTTDNASLTLKVSKFNAPTDVAAVANDDSITVTWTAAEPMMPMDIITESFEGGAEGDGFYEGWTFIDGDGDKVYGANNATIPGIDTGTGYASFVVFNPESCGLTGATTHSGNQCLLSAYTGYEVDDWMITPELSGYAQEVSFWAASYSDTYLESIELLYSTTDTNPESFISIAKYEGIPAEWTEYTASLPNGAKYFAIRSFSEDMFFLLVDDVTYGVATDSGDPVYPIGYNVYRDGVKINDALVQGTSYLDNPGVGYYKYHVSAVFEDGESHAAGPAKVDTSAVGKVNGKLNVFAENRTIVIANAADARVEVSSLDGKLLYVGKGDAKVSVNGGVYIVKVGKAVTKLMVK